MNYSMGLEVVGLFKRLTGRVVMVAPLNGDNTNHIKHQFGLVDLM
jgi:hypothetical protein